MPPLYNSKTLYSSISIDTESPKLYSSLSEFVPTALLISTNEKSTTCVK